MSDNYAISLKRSMAVVGLIAFTAVLVLSNFASIFSERAGAAQLESRSLTLSSTLPGTETEGDPGDPTNGSAATHTFDFTKSVDSNAADRISFQYCANAILK